jgi:Glutamine synthetase
MLSLDELRSDRVGSGRHRHRVLHRHAGPADGQAARREFFLAENEAGHPGEGCNYLLALGDGDGSRCRLRDRELGARYGDFGLVPDLTTLRRIPWHEATAMVQCDVAWHDGTPVGPRRDRC